MHPFHGGEVCRREASGDAQRSVFSLVDGEVIPARSCDVSRFAGGPAHVEYGLLHKLTVDRIEWTGNKKIKRKGEEEGEGERKDYGKGTEVSMMSTRALQFALRRKAGTTTTALLGQPRLGTLSDAHRGEITR